MAVREGLLALLTEGPSHGYQLKTAFEAATGGAWTLNVGQVYTTLDRLQRDGLVTSDDADGQKRYAITAAGREELGGWWSTSPVDTPPPRDELVLKVLFAIEDGAEHALRRHHAAAHRAHPAPAGAAARHALRPPDPTSPAPWSPTPWSRGPRPTCAGSTPARRASCAPATPPLLPTTNGDTHG